MYMYQYQYQIGNNESSAWVGDQHEKLTRVLVIYMYMACLSFCLVIARAMELTCMSPTVIPCAMPRYADPG